MSQIGSAQDSTFAFVLNGHKYNQAEDLMMRAVHEWFSDALDSLDIPTLLDTLAATNDIIINDLKLPESIEVFYEVDESGTYDLLTNVIMDTLNILATGLECEFDVDIIDAGFVIKGVSTYKNGELVLEFGPADTLKPEISVVGTGHILCPGIASIFKTEMEGQIDSLLLGLALMYESESVNGLFSFLNPIQALGIEDSLLVEQALESFPVEMDLYTAEDPNQGIAQLIVEINFLMGTIDNPTAFIGIEPAVIEESQLEAGGFGFLYWVLQRAFPWHEDWTESDRIDFALSTIEEKGLNDYRIELRWTDLQKLAYRGELDPETISPDDIEGFLSNTGNWDTTAFSSLENYLINGMDRDLTPFMAIGVGHEDRMPFDDSGKRIAPATESYDPPDDFTGVSANEYLYNLKIYAHSTVRRFAEYISVWQIENELNAAHFAASIPDWWRKGDLWSDSEFKRRVWNILVDAVRTEDPSAQIIHDFHMLGFIEYLEEFKDDLDIVGINFYPNQLVSLPNMGFSVGEYVWAVRRALKGLDKENLPVWITETGYPGIEINDPADDILLDDDISYFSESRQDFYLETALRSAVKYGSNGFFYYSLATQEDILGSNPAPMRYSGLIRRETDDHKPALATYSEIFSNLYTAPSTIEENLASLPESAFLAQNYPNPFNPKTIINYELPITADVELSIYNLLGQKVVTLVSERQDAGNHQVEWNALGFTSGIYFYRLKTENFSDIKKMMLLK
jgi:hypothetical protein